MHSSYSVLLLPFLCRVKEYGYSILIEVYKSHLPPSMLASSLWNEGVRRLNLSVPIHAPYEPNRDSLCAQAVF
jgi:hypothetical protein